MVKNYLNKFKVFAILLFFMLFIPVYSKESYSHIYIKITDINTSLKEGDKEKAEKLFEDLKLDFKNLENLNSEKGKILKENLDKIKEINEENMVNLTKNLLEFEKEQNPVDQNKLQEEFKVKVYPYIDKLEEAIKTKDVELMRKEYIVFNNVWTRNEKVIRDSNRTYYGKVETSISFLRSSIEVVPFNYDNTISNFNTLKSYITDFIEGKSIEENNEEITLKEAITILENALIDFKNNEIEKGQEKVKRFIELWPSVEGDVSTRNSKLYTKVETEMPIIMVKGMELEYQNKLNNLILELSQIDTKASYTSVDAMFILLREGVEALLIIMALISSLKALNQKRGFKWIYAGSILGIISSVIIAVLLKKLLPTVSSGNNRELIEGFIGIFAVFMMIGIGVWLHSKSSIKSWNKYIDKQMQIVVGTGSFVSMFTLSFLAVFREGAETILFYVGIVPFINIKDLILGIIYAIMVLIIIAIVMIYSSSKIKIHKMFLILTWLIYFLAFKMLGVSIHMLQVIGIIPISVINKLPTIEMLGIYANLEVIISQIIFIIVLFISLKFIKEKE